MLEPGVLGKSNVLKLFDRVKPYCPGCGWKFHEIMRSCRTGEITPQRCPKCGAIFVGYDQETGRISIVRTWVEDMGKLNIPKLYKMSHAQLVAMSMKVTRIMREHSGRACLDNGILSYATWVRLDKLRRFLEHEIYQNLEQRRMT